MDLDEMDEKLERVMSLVGTDLTHRIITEWVNKSSAQAKKRLGEKLLELVPQLARDVLRDTAIQWAREVAGELLNARRAGIEAIVRDELEKLAPQIAKDVAEQVRKRAPLVAEQQVRDLIQRGARSGG